jgi:ATP-binding cassette, subfamily B, bacterial MsbA
MGTSSFQILLRLYRTFAFPYFKLLLLGGVLMLVGALMQGALAKLMEPVLDKIFVEKQQAALWGVAGLVMIVFFIKGLAGYFETQVTEFVGFKVVNDIQKKLYKHLLYADMRFFQENASGQLLSRLTGDVSVLKVVVSSSMTSLCKDFLTLWVLIGVMIWQDWLLSLATIFIFPLAVYPIAKLGRRIRKITSNSQQQMANFTVLAGQTFAHIRHVKAFGREDYEIARVTDKLQQLFSLTMKAVRVRAITSPLMEMLGGVAIVVVIVYGGGLVISGEKTTGSFFSFITALLMAYEPMKRLSRLNLQLQEGIAAATRLFQLLDTRAQIVTPPDAPDLCIKNGDIHIDNITFSYANQPPVLENFSLFIPAGKTIALVGASGSGKSTIINLLARFYDPDSGRILIDKQDIKSVSLRSLKDNIALVSQEVGLFDDTIEHNIRYGLLTATHEQTLEATRAAAALDFIEKLPRGLQTAVGEAGNQLSGGQRQRVAIARALLKNAPILLLDEATSALDTLSEAQVQEALKTLSQGRTTLVVAHRLSTIRHADCIYVMEGGRIIEHGTHQELSQLQGHYALLLKTQELGSTLDKQAAQH